MFLTNFLLIFTTPIGEWSSVRDSISRAEHTVMGDIDDSLFHHKLRALQGLAYLAEGRYFDAAKAFTSVSPDLTNEINSVVSAEDIAMYGSLLGLATMDRTMLHSMVIDGAFKGRLELIPDMREALRHYSRAEYGQCISILQHTVQRDLLIDIHLQPHVPILFDMIREKCIEQYFQPYSSASLVKMGNVFGCTLDEMETIVVKLIGNGSLGKGVRINSADYTVRIESEHSVDRKTRRQTRVAAAKMGIHFTRNAEGMIMRESIVDKHESI
jgi:COP9 signalosome complex subunit 1